MRCASQQKCRLNGTYYPGSFILHLGHKTSPKGIPVEEWQPKKPAVFLWRLVIDSSNHKRGHVYDTNPNNAHVFWREIPPKMYHQHLHPTELGQHLNDPCPIRGKHASCFFGQTRPNGQGQNGQGTRNRRWEWPPNANGWGKFMSRDLSQHAPWLERRVGWG